MRKSFSFKLFNNKKKSNHLQNVLFQFSQIYNYCISFIKRYFKRFGVNPKKSALQKHLKKLMDRGIRPNWKKLGYSQAIQEATDRIYKSYDAFFSWCKNRTGPRKSPPKFKPFRKYKSFTLKQAGWRINQDKGEIFIGKRKYRYHKSRNIVGKVKTVTIKRDQVGDWFVIFSCDLGESYQPEKVIPMTGKSAGFDFGMNHFLITSDNERIDSPQYLKKSLKTLREKSRIFSKKIKGSKNRKKAGKSLARMHRKVSNQRKDFHFKLSTKLLSDYDSLFFEDLNLSEMKSRWGRKISDLGLFQFLNILKFKSSEHQKKFHQIDRFYPSSKKCSCCGLIKDFLALSERTFECSCGHVIDRDLNASINILNEGASSLGLDNVRQSFDFAVVV